MRWGRCHKWTKGRISHVSTSFTTHSSWDPYLFFNIFTSGAPSYTAVVLKKKKQEIKEVELWLFKGLSDGVLKAIKVQLQILLAWPWHSCNTPKWIIWYSPTSFPSVTHTSIISSSLFERPHFRDYSKAFNILMHHRQFFQEILLLSQEYLLLPRHPAPFQWPQFSYFLFPLHLCFPHWTQDTLEIVNDSTQFISISSSG